MASHMPLPGVTLLSSTSPSSGPRHFMDEKTKAPRKENDLSRTAQPQSEKVGWD